MEVSVNKRFAVALFGLSSGFPFQELSAGQRDSRQCTEDGIERHQRLKREKGNVEEYIHLARNEIERDPAEMSGNVLPTHCLQKA